MNKKSAKWMKWGLVLVIIIGSIHITDNGHIYKTVGNTILKGRMGPTIDDHVIFNNRSVETSTHQPWQKDSAYNANPLTKEELAFHQKYETAAFLLIKDGKILHESYFNDYNMDSYTNSWSMAKSVVSVLIGCMIKDGVISSEDEMMEQYFDEFKGTGITIKHLLTMSSGLSYHENYLNPFGYAARALYGDDLYHLVEDYRPDEEPGKYFKYKSGDSQWLSFLITKLTGKTVSEYASEKIWKTVGAKNPALWSLDTEGGKEKAFCCFNSNARDFARLGQLWLNQGVWGDDTLVSQEYWSKSIELANLIERDGSKNHRYGYQWWILSDMDQPAFYCRGLNGQYILVFPDLNAVMVRLGQTEPDEKINKYDADIFTYYNSVMRLLEID